MMGAHAPRSILRFTPPARLRPLSSHTAGIVRWLWVAAFLFALAADIAGAAHAVREFKLIQPAFYGLGLDYEVADDGQVDVGTLARSGRPGLPITSRIVAVDGKPVATDISIDELTRTLKAVPAPVVRIDLRRPDGTIVRLSQARNASYDERTVVSFEQPRMMIRMALALVACGALLLCSFLLAMRRPRDPVAMLFALSFALMAATIDPAVRLWPALGLGTAYDVVADGWFYLFTIALAAFPNGVFAPRLFRWLIVLGIPVSAFMSLDIDISIQALVAGAVIAMLLFAQVRRYRRLSEGIERQQIKWAGFGFALGFLFVLTAFFLMPLFTDAQGNVSSGGAMIVVALFSGGMAIVPLGLMIALTRFRLWEADTVISRSAAYAVVTLIVGVVWAASADLVKLIIFSIMGQQHEATATTVGAVIAAGIFAPTQSVVLGWTRKKFGGPDTRLADLPDKLAKWKLTETPQELGLRVLAAIDRAVHPASAAIEMAAPDGEQVIAELHPDSLLTRPEQTIPLADEDGEVGRLLLGARSDGNRYNRAELDSLRRLAPVVADALRASRSRFLKESGLQQMIEEMRARLAQLEGGPTPSAA